METSNIVKTMEDSMIGVEVNKEDKAAVVESFRMLIADGVHKEESCTVTYSKLVDSFLDY